MKPVTIAFYSDATYTGGAERYLHLLASNLDRNRFKAVMIVNSDRTPEVFGYWMKRDGIPVFNTSLRLIGIPSGVREFIGLLHDINPSLLHINLPGPYDSEYGLVAPLAKYSGVNHIVTTEHLPMVPSFLKGRCLKRFSDRWIDRVLTVSEDNSGHLVSEHGTAIGKIRVVYIGIPDPGEQEPLNLRKSLRIKQESFVIAAVGSLEDRKGYPTALDAMAGLPEDVHLVIAGKGEKESEYRRRTGELGLEERIHFIGFRDDIESIMREVDLLILPSVMEATPYVIVEAMAAGLPVVASGIYGIPELVKDGKTGILVPPGDTEALALAVKHLARDSDRRKDMGAEGRRRYESRFRIERSVSETVDVYSELIADSIAEKADVR